MGNVSGNFGSDPHDIPDTSKPSINVTAKTVPKALFNPPSSSHRIRCRQARG